MRTRLSFSVLLLAAAMLTMLPGSEGGPPPEFFLLVDRTHQECSSSHDQQPAFCYRDEDFIIARCPTEPRALVRLVQAFNQRTLSDEELAKWGRYSRTFYRESARTPRDFQGDEQDWGGDSLDDHYEDRMISVSFYGSRKSPHVTLWRDGYAKDPPRIPAE